MSADVLLFFGGIGASAVFAVIGTWHITRRMDQDTLWPRWRWFWWIADRIAPLT